MSQSDRVSHHIGAVIPVLDLMIGQIVLAQAGNRDQYRPVHTRLTHNSQPLGVAEAIFHQTGCDWLYLADIDSFSGAHPNWTVYNELLNRGFGLWIDADWTVGDRRTQIAQKIDRPERLKVILSSETLSDLDQFDTFDELKAQSIEPIFSLDIKAESLITKPGKLTDTQPLELVHRAYDRGVRQMIVLDLDQVGTMSGCPNCEQGVGALIQEISSELNDVAVTSGGGVRGAGDIQSLLDLGCDHVLVASAIHECKLTPDDVTNLTPNPKRAL